jgi:hypothetical protein
MKISTNAFLLTIKGFNSKGWKNDAVSFIGEALELLNINIGFKKEVKKIKITDHHVALPASPINIINIQYEDLNKKLYDITLNNFNNFVNLCTDRTCYPEYTAQINGIILLLSDSLKDGCIVFTFYDIERDKDNNPLIPDEPHTINALRWYVIYQLLVNGYEHITIKDWREAFQMWEMLTPRAINNANPITVNTVKSIANVWLNLNDQNLLDS